MDDTLPCPFCGEQPYDGLGKSSMGLFVFCEHCETQGPTVKWEPAQKQAIAAWNTRAQVQMLKVEGKVK